MSNELSVWVVERNFRTFGGSLVKEQTHLAGLVSRVSVGEDDFGLGDVPTAWGVASPLPRRNQRVLSLDFPADGGLP